jgi:hypothetical protein
VEKANKNSSPLQKEVNNTMSKRTPISFTRQQLYDEVWKYSVRGVSKKHDIPYGMLMKRLKEASIPVPPSGYWMKVSFGKDVDKPELSEPKEGVVNFFNQKEKAPITDKEASKSETKESSLKKPMKVEANTSPAYAKSNLPPMSEAETVKEYGQTYNVYDRNILYKEVWERPVIEVAKKYQVSDVAIRKVCKSMNIPTPPLGYWAKLRAGKAVSKPTLPECPEKTKKLGIRSDIVEKVDIKSESKLEFLPEEDRIMIFNAANLLSIPNEDTKMHASIIAYRKKMSIWSEQAKKELNQRYGKKQAPIYLSKELSDEGRLRAYRIIDTLIKAMAPLGCSLNEDLDFIIWGEKEKLTFSESTDKTPHVLTREENYQMLKYEEEKRKYSYASQPQIRKYDYIFNGKMTVSVNGRNYYRDCNTYQIEDKIGNLMIELYESAERSRKARLEQEEIERKCQEEIRKRIKRRERYNQEVKLTTELINKAEDYNTACNIRNYVNAVEASGELDEETVAWINWARAKADWFDPIIHREDELLGLRQHGENEKNKELKERFYY